MVIPAPFLIGNDKYEVIKLSKSIFSFDKKEFKSLLEDGLTNLVFQPTKFSKMSFLTSKQGLLVNQYIINFLLTESKIEPGEAFVYLEHFGSGFYLLMVNENGDIETELVETVIFEGVEQGQRDFDSDKFDLLTSRIDNFVDSKRELVKGFVSSAITMPAAEFTIDGLSHVSQVEIKKIMDSIRLGQVFDFDLIDEDSETSRVKMGVTSNTHDLYIPQTVQISPIVTTLFVTYYKDESGISKLPSNFISIDAEEFIRRKKILRIGFGILFIATAAILTVPDYLKKQRELEAKKNEIITIQRTIDEYAEYRDIILKDGINSEMMLKQISLALTAFENERKNQRLKWFPVQVNAENTNVSFIMEPTSNYADNANLKQFSKDNNLANFFLNNSQVIGFGATQYMVNEEVYLTPVDDEIKFLKDTVNWMFDHSEVVIGQRTAHSNWASVIVDVNFNCWLPQHFEYFSTQLYPANLGFVQLEAEYSDSATTEDGTQQIMPCGYNGTLKLEIYGHNGLGHSTSASNNEQGAS